MRGCSPARHRGPGGTDRYREGSGIGTMNWHQWRAGVSVLRARIATELIPYGGIILLLAILFAILAYIVQRGDATAFDGAVRRALRPDDTAPGASGVLWLGPDVGAASVAVVVFLALWQAWQRRWVAAATLLGSMAGAFTLTRVLKVLIGRTRPEDGLARQPITWSEFLFPSTHTVLTVVGYGLLAYLLHTRLRRWRLYILGSYGAVVTFVGVSLVYLDTHYFTDVVGGLLVGGGWLIATMRLLAALGVARDEMGKTIAAPSYAGSVDRYEMSRSDHSIAPQGERR